MHCTPSPRFTRGCEPTRRGVLRLRFNPVPPGSTCGIHTTGVAPLKAPPLYGAADLAVIRRLVVQLDRPKLTPDARPDNTNHTDDRSSNISSAPSHCGAAMPSSTTDTGDDNPIHRACQLCSPSHRLTGRVGHPCRTTRK